MAGRAGGIAAPSYSQVITEGSKDNGKQHFKKPLEKVSEASSKGTLGRNRLQELEGDQLETNKEKENGGSNGKPNSIRMTGICQPKSSIIPRVILRNPALQAHRDHMTEHAIICKFMGLWPMERVLHILIKFHWKPKVEIHLHLGSKGFFTVVFTCLEDKDSVFGGGPYFYAAA